MHSRVLVCPSTVQRSSYSERSSKIRLETLHDWRPVAPGAADEGGGGLPGSAPALAAGDGLAPEQAMNMANASVASGGMRVMEPWTKPPRRFDNAHECLASNGAAPRGAVRFGRAGRFAAPPKRSGPAEGSRRTAQFFRGRGTTTAQSVASIARMRSRYCDGLPQDIPCMRETQIVRRPRVRTVVRRPLKGEGTRTRVAARTDSNYSGRGSIGGGPPGTGGRVRSGQLAKVHVHRDRTSFPATCERHDPGASPRRRCPGVRLVRPSRASRNSVRAGPLRSRRS